jgi:hypothetical protein
MRRWAGSWPGILVLVGILTIILGAEQHFIGLLAIPHLAIYLGVVGLLLLIPGILMSIPRAPMRPN